MMILVVDFGRDVELDVEVVFERDPEMDKIAAFFNLDLLVAMQTLQPDFSKLWIFIKRVSVTFNMPYLSQKMSYPLYFGLKLKLKAWAFM